MFDPKEIDDNLKTRFSLYYQGLYKENPEEFILKVIKGSIEVGTEDKERKAEENVKRKIRQFVQNKSN